MCPTDYELSGDFGDQCGLFDDMPEPGMLYKIRGHPVIVCVVALRQAKRTWITVRSGGEEHELALVDFQAIYRRCRPDGSLL